MWFLRLSVSFVAVFVFIFSYFFKQKADIAMFLIWSGAIYLGGAGAVLIGGLYWKRGTTSGAWTAMFISITMAVVGFSCIQFWSKTSAFISQTTPGIWQLLTAKYPGLKSDKFIFTFAEMYLFTMILAIVGYLSASLVTNVSKRGENINMDRILHRGRYSLEKGHNLTDDTLLEGGWKKALGFSRKLTGDDKLIFYFSYSYITLSVALFIGGLILHKFFGATDQWWLAIWHWYIWVIFAVTVFVIIWFAIGGFRDLARMYKKLATAERDERDMGMVVKHHNIDENEGGY
jgi:SSS family solute:Na+ symporter